MTIEEIVFEFVLVAAKTTVAGAITVLRAILEDSKRLLENREPKATNALSEASAAW
jgi:hypothetical protein